MDHTDARTILLLVVDSKLGRTVFTKCCLMSPKEAINWGCPNSSSCAKCRLDHVCLGSHSKLWWYCIESKMKQHVMS